MTTFLLSLFFLVFQHFASGIPTPLQDEGRGPAFQEPGVFLTLSAVAGVQEGEWKDTEFELNWYGWESTWMSGDWVGLFDQEPLPPLSAPLVQIAVSQSSAETGYRKTDIRFGRPEINSDDEGDNCLGFWIAYIRANNETVKVNCFRKYPRWMKNLSDTIGETPLSLLMIPGTHDAGAIREYDGVGSENPIVRYSVTQEEQLYRQFCHGIRYVDMRVAYYPATEEKFWINHGSVRYQPIHTLFTAVRRFVEETGEIIFMDHHGFPVGFDDATVHDAYLEYLTQEMGDLLLWEDQVPRNPTPNDVWATNKTVIVTYQVDSISQAHPYLWPYLIHGWGDKNTVDPLHDYFRDVALPTYGCRGIWWSAMAEMTPSATDAILYPLRGLRGFAQMINLPLTYWWMRESWYSRTMIVSTDFFLGNNIIEMSVHLNAQQAVCPNIQLNH